MALLTAVSTTPATWYIALSVKLMSSTMILTPAATSALMESAMVAWVLPSAAK